MSNALAIAAVTATLRTLLVTATNAAATHTTISTAPPDRARKTGKQLNLFLYHLGPSAAWSNRELPDQVRRNETGPPPLALTLRYLLSAYGDEDDGESDHQVLGIGMQALHDHPLLLPDEIQKALKDADLARQIERVRITLLPLSVEEMTKLWSSFHTAYRISAAYEVSVVLIDSLRPAKAPLPVLARSAGDTGPAVQADLLPPYPHLASLELPAKRSSVEPGETIKLLGHHLFSAGTTTQVRFRHRLWQKPEDRPATATDAEVEVAISVDDAWPAGVYTVAVVADATGKARITNELALPVAPKLDPVSPAVLTTVVRAADGTISLPVTFHPKVQPEQRVALLLGSQEIPAPPFAAAVDTLIFKGKVDPGVYHVRLRVDGVDSEIVDRSGAALKFLTSQRVQVS